MTGTGTALDPYIILTRADLEWIWGDDGDATACYKLGADINLSGSDFTPIGIYGSFDGNHHKITGMTIEVSDANPVGLFGAVNGLYGSGTAVVKDLAVCGAVIHVTTTTGNTSQNIGILCGNAFQADISNVSVSGTITLDGAGTMYAVGGLCGIAEHTTFSTCHVAVTIDKPEQREAGQYTAVLPLSYCGGLLGYAVAANGTGSTIEDCVIALTVSNSNTALFAGKHVLFDLSELGGIVGRVSDAATTVSGCQITVTMPMDTAFNSNYYGGLIGRATAAAAFTDCRVSGNMHGVNDVGGLCGWAKNMTFTRCGADVDVDGVEYVGGGCGAGGDVASDCTFTDCYALGSAWASYYVAGFSGAARGTYVRCYATGAVTCGGSYHGGFNVSVLDSCTDCFWDTQTTGEATSGGGTGKTTAEMQTQSTFTNWNFSSVWNIASGLYPFLRTAFATVTDGCATLVHSFPWVGKFQLSHVTA